MVVKSKMFTLEQEMKTQRGSRSIAVLFLLPRQQMGMGSQRHAAAALPPGNDTVLIA